MVAVLHADGNGGGSQGQGNNHTETQGTVGQDISQEVPVPGDFSGPHKRQQHQPGNQGPESADQEGVQGQILHQRGIQAPADSSQKDQGAAGQGRETGHGDPLLSNEEKFVLDV